MSQLKYTIGLIALLAIAGCTEETPQFGADGGQEDMTLELPAAGADCQVDSECVEGQRCSFASGKGSCSNCTEICADAQECNEPIGECGTPCEAGTCPLGQYCAERFCAPGCVQVGDVAEGCPESEAVCEDLPDMEPDDGGVSDAGLDMGASCEERTYRCIEGSCVGQFDCTDDAQCSGETTCLNGQCRTPNQNMEPEPMQPEPEPPDPCFCGADRCGNECRRPTDCGGPPGQTGLTCEAGVCVCKL